VDGVFIESQQVPPAGYPIFEMARLTALLQPIYFTPEKGQMLFRFFGIRHSQHMAKMQMLTLLKCLTHVKSIGVLLCPAAGNPDCSIFSPKFMM